MKIIKPHTNKKMKNKNNIYLKFYSNNIEVVCFEIVGYNIPHGDLNDWEPFIKNGMKEYLYQYTDIEFFEIIHNGIIQYNPKFLNIKHIRLYNKNAKQ